MKYHLATAVWGKEYTDFFVNITLPNLLTPGNLEALSKTHEPVFRIYTRPEDKHTITDSAAFKIAAKMLDVKLETIDDKDFAQKYSIISKYHQKAIEAAIKDGAALVIMGPDTIRAEGYMSNMLRIAESGKKAIMISEIRVAKDTFLPEFLGQFTEKSALRGVTSRQLVNLAMRHLHPVSKSFLWNAKNFHNAPSYIYFEVPNEGILARCFHLSPLMINPVCKDATFSTTIDGDYIQNACPKIDDIYVSVDSDELMSVELSSLSMPPNSGYLPANPLNIAAFAKYSTSSHHRDFLRKKIRFHRNGLSSKWREVEQFSDKAINRIFFWLKFEPFLFWPYGAALRSKLLLRNTVKLFLGETLTRKAAGRIKSLRRKTV